MIINTVKVIAMIVTATTGILIDISMKTIGTTFMTWTDTKIETTTKTTETSSDIKRRDSLEIMEYHYEILSQGGISSEEKQRWCRPMVLSWSTATSPSQPPCQLRT